MEQQANSDYQKEGSHHSIPFQDRDKRIEVIVFRVFSGLSCERPRWFNPSSFSPNMGFRIGGSVLRSRQ